MSETAKFSERVFTAEEMDKIVAMFIRAAGKQAKEAKPDDPPDGESAD